MSRHRNVRHLIAEEDYGYDDDDDYYDDDDDNYDEYDGGSNYSKPPVAAAKNQPTNQKKKAGTPNNKQPPQQQTSKAQQQRQQQTPLHKQQQQQQQQQQQSKKSPMRGNSSSNSSNNRTPPRGGGSGGGASANTTTSSIKETPTATSAMTATTTSVRMNTTARSIPVGAASGASAAAITTYPGHGGGGSIVTLSSPQQSSPSSSTKPTTTTTHPIPKILLDEANSSNSNNNNKTNHRKPHLSVVVLGHVDAGKSTLTGRLLYHASQVSGGSSSSNNNSYKANKGGSGSNSNSNTNNTMNFAWFLDENEQERIHGVTMDVAVKAITTPRYRFVLQDAPGHADYVPAMITGAAGADAALLTVDATDIRTALGSGQFREHAVLARGLGISQLLLVINKMDLIQWKQDVYNSIVQQLTTFLTTQIGYSINKIRSVPVSGLTGMNVTTPIVVKSAAVAVAMSTNNRNSNNHNATVTTDAAWYHGPTLWQALDGFDPPPTAKRYITQLYKPVLVILTDVLSEQGSNKGVSVRAKIVQGWVQAGEALIVLPIGDDTSLIKFHSLSAASADGEISSTTSKKTNTSDQDRQQYATVGELLDAVVTNVDVTRLSMGCILARPQQLPMLSTICCARVWMLDHVSVPVIRGTAAMFHIHYLDVPCHISQLIRIYKHDGITIAKEQPRALTQHVQALVEITLSVPICMEPANECRALGRFILRRGGDSIAIGRIEQVMTI